MIKRIEIKNGKLFVNGKGVTIDNKSGYVILDKFGSGNSSVPKAFYSPGHFDKQLQGIKYTSCVSKLIKLVQENKELWEIDIYFYEDWNAPTSDNEGEIWEQVKDYLGLEIKPSDYPNGLDQSLTKLQENKIINRLNQSEKLYKGSDILKKVKEVIIDDYGAIRGFEKLLNQLKEYINENEFYSYNDAYKEIYYNFGGDNRIAADALNSLKHK